MLDFLSSISDFLQSIGSAILNIFEGFWEIISLYPTFSVLLNTVSISMPGVLQAFISVGIALSILFMIVGRI